MAFDIKPVKTRKRIFFESALIGLVGCVSGATVAHWFIGSATSVHLITGLISVLVGLASAMAFNAFAIGVNAAENERKSALNIDPPTGLLSRAGLADALKAFQNSDKGEGRGRDQTYLIAFEFDSIKDVNELYGHAIGDTVIRILGDRLTRMVGRLGPVSRIGGSEYIIAIKAASNERELKAAVDALIEAMSQPIKLGGATISVFGNCGVVKLHDTQTSLETALRCATLARASARDAGRGTWALYHPEMSQVAAYRKWLESELSSAIARREFTLNYQSQVEHPSGRVKGYEALLRWTHHEKGAISPMEFIAIAESCGLIRQIGAWVLRKACEDARLMPSHLQMSVNVSPVQLTDVDFIPTLRAVIAETGIEPSRLELEVTESAVISDFGKVRRVFAEIGELGCSIAIDDFGTGYSNLTNLAELPFQKLKIDKSFVDRMATNRGITNIVATIVNLAHSLNATVIAEGVETEHQADLLAATGCHNVQGYYYSKPLPLAAILERHADGVERISAPSAHKEAKPAQTTTPTRAKDAPVRATMADAMPPVAAQHPMAASR